MSAKLSFPFFIVGLLFSFSVADAQIAAWTYEPQLGALSNPTPNTGIGSSAVVNLGGGTIAAGTRTGMAGTGCGTQNGVTAWALEPFDPGSANESNGAQFDAGTVGYQNIIFTWDQRWSNTCPNTVRLQYTIDGSTWNNFTMTSGNTTYCLGSINANGCFEVNTTGDVYTRISVNLSSVTALNNNANFGVRLMASYYQSTSQFRQTSSPGSVAGNAGTWRFDNVTIAGTLLPGPTASIISNVAPGSMCVGGSANIKVAITGGTGPFTVIYSDGTTNYTVNNYTSGNSITVAPASTKTYTIVSVSNANGVAGTGNSGSAVITVNSLPAVPTCSNLTSCTATTTTAVVLPAGSPAGGTYSIANPYTGPSTTFTYTVTNGSGCSRTSTTYTFTRNVAPAITLQPSGTPQTVCQNDAFAPITVTAAGTTLSYQWYRNTGASTTGGTALTGALFPSEIANGSKTASFTPLSNTVGTYYYYVIVTGCTSVKSTTIPGAYTVIPASVAGTVSTAQAICSGSVPNDLTLSGNAGSVLRWEKADDAAFTLNLQTIANTTITLTGVDIGALSQTTYFRAVVQNGSCTIAYTSGIQILVKSTTWNGVWSNGLPDSTTTAIFAADYSSGSDLNACSVQVNSGNVVFNPGHTLTIQNALAVSGGTLTFENNASLVQVNNAPNNGLITYKRDTTPVRKYDYTYWSSPVDMEILASFSPLTLSDKYFWFDTAIYNWHSVAAPGITPMDIGKGYIIRSPQTFDPVIPAVFSGSFIGVPNNGNYTVPIDVSGANNLNLIGNPYPSAISADLFMSDAANTTSIGTGTSIYLWTHNNPITANNYTASDYAVYNYMGGVGTAPALGLNNNIPNGFIGAGQSFMIKGLATGTATFKNSMRVSGNNSQFFRTASAEKSRVWLELKNNQGAYKQLLVGYIQDATNDLDSGFDAEVMEAGNPVSLYSILGEDKLSIQGRALPFDETQQIPLGYKTSTIGNFEIGLSDFDGLFLNQTVYLEDKQLNVIHDLKQSDYSFNTNSGTFDDRFVLRFTASTLTTGDITFNENTVIVYKEHDHITIHSGNLQIKNVRIFDLTGRLLFERNNINHSEVSLDSGWAKQMMIVQVELQDNEIVNRKFSN